MRRRWFIPGVLALSLASESCFMRKAAPAFTPPPLQPQTTAPTDPQVLPPPPKIDADSSANTPPKTPATIPPDAAPPPRRRSRPNAERKTAPAAPKSEAQAPPADPPITPTLGQIFTAAELKQYNRSLDDSLARVKKVLVTVERMTLNPEQSEIANRIRTFQKQAEQARERDLVTAVSLAKRADLLATDLIGRLP